MVTFNAVITHEKPHLDEIVAIWLLRKFGEEKFPGISAAKIVFWSTGGEIPDGRSPEEYERDGILLIGVGRSRFDEHPAVNGERKQGECAATLVAKALGVEEELSFERILKYVVTSDLRGGDQPFDLAYLVKLLHQQYPDNPEKAMEWAIQGLEAKYLEQLRFCTSTKEEFERTAKVEEVQGPGGRVLKMVVITSDDDQAGKFARSAQGGHAAIVVQAKSSGNVQIFTNRKYGLTLYDVAQIIRFVEQQMKGRLMTTDWKTLASEGKVEGAEEWFYHHAGQMLLNGSLTAKDVPPTRLSLERIKEIVRIGINPSAFEPKHEATCRQGICTAGRANPCPWYSWGIHRCRQIRYKTKNP